jgi:hypothetical protein
MLKHTECPKHDWCCDGFDLLQGSGISDAVPLPGGSVMVGVVTTRHLLTHPFLITREFGGRCLLRCFWLTLTADHEVTFLECALPPPTRVAPN